MTQQIVIKNHLLKTPVKISIVTLKSQGYSNRETADLIKTETKEEIHQATVGRTWNKWSRDHTIRNLWNQNGAPRKLSDRSEREIIRKSLKNRSLSANFLKMNLMKQISKNPISRSKVNQLLVRNGLYSSKVMQKFEISQKI